MPQTIEIAAIDGVPVNSQDGLSREPDSGDALPTADCVPGRIYREWPLGHCEVAQLVTQNTNTGIDGDSAPNRPLFNIQVRAYGHLNLPRMTTSATSKRSALT